MQQVQADDIMYRGRRRKREVDDTSRWEALLSKASSKRGEKSNGLSAPMSKTQATISSCLNGTISPALPSEPTRAESQFTVQHSKKGSDAGTKTIRRTSNWDKLSAREREPRVEVSIAKANQRKRKRGQQDKERSHASVAPRSLCSNSDRTSAGRHKIHAKGEGTVVAKIIELSGGSGRRKRKLNPVVDRRDSLASDRSTRDRSYQLPRLPSVSAEGIQKNSESSRPLPASKRPRANDLNSAFEAQRNATEAERTKARELERIKRADKTLSDEQKARYVGMDCEMVGIGPDGTRSALAWCCLVDWDGNVIYDKYVIPQERVTDFRTFVSGVKAKHLRAGVPFRQCQLEVGRIVKDKYLVGHALSNDLQALMLSHPRRMIRDTATYRPYQKPHGKKGGKLRPRSLKQLTKEYLDRSIQEGQHHPAEDARAALELYKRVRSEWEKSLAATRGKKGRQGHVDQLAR